MLSLERTCFQNLKKSQKKVKKSQIEKSKKSQQKVKKKVNSQQKVKKKVKQKLCIGKQVKEKLVTRQIASFLLMAYGFQSIQNSRTFLVVQLSPFPAPSQPQPPTPESPQSRRIPTQPQPLSQGLFSPKPAAAQILGQVAARARLWAGCGWLLAEGSG